MELRHPRPTAAWLRPAVSMAVVALVASPALRQRDSYPLSTYPVYADARPGVAELPTAVGVTEDGERVRLSPTVIGASDDPLIVADRVADAVAADRADRLCQAIAERAATDDGAIFDPTGGDGTTAGDGGGGGGALAGVEVVTETVDLVATAADEAPPLGRTVHAACPVPPP